MRPELEEVWRKQKPTKLPWLMAFYPASTRISRPLWSGPLDQAVCESLIDSPARQEIAKNILADDLAVWLLLESGDAEKDGCAREILDREAERMTATLELPAQMADLDEEFPEVNFSTVIVSRDNSNEELFVNMLLGSEIDLADYDEPIVFPVYGRGRLLYGLVGGGITEDNIRKAGEFLAGPCSCVVKDQNPGIDLLMKVDWSRHVERSFVDQAESISLAGIASLTETVEVMQAVAATTPELQVKTIRSPLARNILLALGLVIVVTCLLALNTLRKTLRRSK